MEGEGRRGGLTENATNETTDHLQYKGGARCNMVLLSKSQILG